jgi:hypothetical protein
VTGSSNPIAATLQKYLEARLVTWGRSRRNLLQYSMGYEERISNYSHVRGGANLASLGMWLLSRRSAFTGSKIGVAEEKIHMLQAHPFGEKLPLSTAMLSNVALVLLMWNLALRLALLFGRWATGALP